MSAYSSRCRCDASSRSVSAAMRSRNSVFMPERVGFDLAEQAQVQQPVVEALKSLGADRRHSKQVVIGRFRELTKASETRDDSGKTLWQR